MVHSRPLSGVRSLAGMIAIWLPVAAIGAFAFARIKVEGVANAAETLGVTRLQPTSYEQEIARKFVVIQTGIECDRKEFVPFLKDMKLSQECLWRAHTEIMRLKLSLALGLSDGATPGQMVQALIDAHHRGDKKVRERVNDVLSPSNNRLRPGTDEARYWKVMWGSVRSFLGHVAQEPMRVRIQDR